MRLPTLLAACLLVLPASGFFFFPMDHGSPHIHKAKKDKIIYYTAAYISSRID